MDVLSAVAEPHGIARLAFAEPRNGKLEELGIRNGAELVRLRPARLLSPPAAHRDR